MFNSPYVTTPMSGHLMQKTIHQVKQALVEESLVVPVPALKNLYAVIGKTPAIQGISAFTHPITLEYRGQDLTVIDLRPYENTITTAPEGLMIAKDTPAGFVLKAAILQMIWQDNPSRFEAAMDLPLMVYSSWVANTLTRNLGLDPAVSLQLRALAGWFFQCMHSEPFDITDTTIAAKARKLTIVTSVPGETVLSVIQEAGFLNNVIDFAKAINRLPSAKLERVNVPMLIQVLGNGWFGTSDPRALVAVSLEFPPYFYAIVHSAIADRYYRKAAISLVVEQFDRGDRFKTYDIQIKRMVEEGV